MTIQFRVGRKERPLCPVEVARKTIEVQTAFKNEPWYQAAVSNTPDAPLRHSDVLGSDMEVAVALSSHCLGSGDDALGKMVAS